MQNAPSHSRSTGEGANKKIIVGAASHGEGKDMPRAPVPARGSRAPLLASRARSKKGKRVARGSARETFRARSKIARARNAPLRISRSEEAAKN